MEEVEGREITAINVDMGCNLCCEECEKYFECTALEKQRMRQLGRMEKIRQALSQIRHKVVVVGGKGGVGKTIIAVNLAMALAMKGRKVALLDQNLDGPSIPRMLGIEGKRLQIGEEGILPVTAYENLCAVSMGLILKEGEVLTWFHDMKVNATEEFLSHVAYGEKDYLVIDVPAGTSTETTTVLTFIPDIDAVVIVTVPSLVSQGVAKRAILLCKKGGVEKIGIIENMSGFSCHYCGAKIDLLQKGGGELLARETGLPFWGRIPMDTRLSVASDEGIPFVHKFPDIEASKVMFSLASKVEEAVGWR